MARNKEALREIRDNLDRATAKMREAQADLMRIEYDAVRYLVGHCGGEGLKLDRRWLDAVTRS